MKKLLHIAKNILVVSIFCFVLPIFILVGINLCLQKEATFKENTFLCGVDLSNLTLNDAKQRLENSISIDIRYKDKVWHYDENDFNIKSNIHTILEEMQKTNRKNGSNKSKIVQKIIKMGFNDRTAINYTLTGIDKKLEEIANEISLPAISASAKYNYSNNNFDITPDTPGQLLNIEKLYTDIALNLQNSPKVQVEASTIPVKPEYTYADMLRATKKQSEFSTSFTSSNQARKNNIKLCVNAITNKVIYPGEVFSFNNVVGKRTIENGYKEANIIKDGEFVKGVGGGVCQVSSTLFNAVLLSNIEVTESHKHTLPVSYVSPCLDAMVSWGTADLKFKNTTDLPIFIIGNTINDKINFKIYGNTNPENYLLKTRSEIINTIKPNKDTIIPDKMGTYSDKILYKGEFLRIKNSKAGYEAKSYLDCYKGGKLLKSKMIRHATYSSQPGILYEGVEDLPQGFTIPKNDFVINNNSIVYE